MVADEVKCLIGYSVEFACPVQSYIALLPRAMQALESEKKYLRQFLSSLLSPQSSLPSQRWMAGTHF